MLCVNYGYLLISLVQYLVSFSFSRPHIVDIWSVISGAFSITQIPQPISDTWSQWEYTTVFRGSADNLELLCGNGPLGYLASQKQMLLYHFSCVIPYFLLGRFGNNEHLGNFVPSLHPLIRLESYTLQQRTQHKDEDDSQSVIWSFSHHPLSGSNVFQG